MSMRKKNEQKNHLENNSNLMQISLIVKKLDRNREALILSYKLILITADKFKHSKNKENSVFPQ